MELFCLAFAAAFCGLDATLALQVSLSRPFVSAALTGLMLGQPGLGLAAGSLVELLWLGAMPVGSVVPPDFTLAGALTVFLAAAAHAAEPRLSWEACLFGATLFSLLPAWLGGLGEVWQRRWHRGLVQRAEAAVAAGRESALSRAVAASLLMGFARLFFSAALLGAVCRLPFIWLMQGLNAVVLRALGWMYWVGLLLGLAVLLDQFWDQRWLKASAASLLLSSVAIYYFKLPPWQVLLAALIGGCILGIWHEWRLKKMMKGNAA